MEGVSALLRNAGSDAAPRLGASLACRLFVLGEASPSQRAPLVRQPPSPLIPLPPGGRGRETSLLPLRGRRVGWRVLPSCRQAPAPRLWASLACRLLALGEAPSPLIPLPQRGRGRGTPLSSVSEGEGCSMAFQPEPSIATVQSRGLPALTKGWFPSSHPPPESPSRIAGGGCPSPRTSATGDAPFGPSRGRGRGTIGRAKAGGASSMLEACA